MRKIFRDIIAGVLVLGYSFFPGQKIDAQIREYANNYSNKEQEISDKTPLILEHSQSYLSNSEDNQLFAAHRSHSSHSSHSSHASHASHASHSSHYSSSGSGYYVPPSPPSPPAPKLAPLTPLPKIGKTTKLDLNDKSIKSVTKKITSPFAKLRNGPDSTYKLIIKPKVGDKVVIKKIKGKWSEVYLITEVDNESKIEEGWIYNSLLGEIDDDK